MHLFIVIAKVGGRALHEFEALASGTPIVVTGTGWNPEIVDINNEILLSVDLPLGIVTSAINEMIKIKPTIMNSDLLYGKHTWTDLGNQLFILK